MAERAWTAQQLAVREWMATGALPDGSESRHLLVRARAGSGKTSSILWAIDAAPEREIILCAFNKRIAEELASRLTNPRAEAKTLHALGFGVVRRFWSRVRVDAKRGYALAERAAGQQAPDAIVGMIAKLASRLKESCPLAVPGDSRLEAIAYGCDCVPDEAEWGDLGWDVRTVISAALKAMDLARERSTEIDYSDMLYLPLAQGWVTGQYDLVVVDEAQDMSASQLLLAQRLCRPDGRICLVGDDRQAIYGFRGADPGGLDRLKAALDAGEVGLTTTFRCPRLVVERARAIVPDFTCPDGAADGVLSALRADAIPDTASEGDVVLSRTNAPLAGVCLALLRRGTRARIEGRDIAAGLLALTRRWKTATTVDEFLDRLQTWEEREVRRAAKRDDEAKVHLVRDQAETLLALSDGLAAMAELRSRIESLFADSQNGDRARVVVCSTVHKAKGLEWDRVFALEWTLYPGKAQREPSIEESNIEYVMVTRARRELVSVSKSREARDAESREHQGASEDAAPQDRPAEDGHRS